MGGAGKKPVSFPEEGTVDCVNSPNISGWPCFRRRSSTRSEDHAKEAGGSDDIAFQTHELSSNTVSCQLTLTSLWTCRSRPALYCGRCTVSGPPPATASRHQPAKTSFFFQKTPGKHTLSSAIAIWFHSSLYKCSLLIYFEYC